MEVGGRGESERGSECERDQQEKNPRANTPLSRFSTEAFTGNALGGGGTNPSDKENRAIQAGGRELDRCNARKERCRSTLLARINPHTSIRAAGDSHRKKLFQSREKPRRIIEAVPAAYH